MNVTGGAQGRQVFRGTRFDKWLYRSLGPFVSLLVVTGLFSPGRGGNAARIVVAVVITASLGLTWRGWRLGTVTIDHVGLTAYGALRRWRWTWAELDYVELGSGPLPLNPETSNRPLVVHTRDDRDVRLTSINGRSRGQNKSCWLAAAVDSINERIRSETAQ